MSKVSYKRKEHIYWDVLCTWLTGNKVHKYKYHSFNKSLEGSLEDAKRDVVWGNHPTFKAKVVGVRFE